MFADLEVPTGKLSANAFHPKHTNIEFVDFLGRVVDARPGVELHVIWDNNATPKQQNVKDWLAEHPRVSLHFTPTSCSWLNMVEIFFGIITRQCLKGGAFSSVAKPEEAMARYRSLRIDQLQRLLAASRMSSWQYWAARLSSEITAHRWAFLKSPNGKPTLPVCLRFGCRPAQVPFGVTCETTLGDERIFLVGRRMFAPVTEAVAVNFPARDKSPAGVVGSDPIGRSAKRLDLPDHASAFQPSRADSSEICLVCHTIAQVAA